LLSRQLHTLWERMEALRRENAVLDERLEVEIQLQKKTQAELYASRAQVRGQLEVLELAVPVYCMHPFIFLYLLSECCHLCSKT